MVWPLLEPRVGPEAAAALPRVRTHGVSPQSRAVWAVLATQPEPGRDQSREPGPGASRSAVVADRVRRLCRRALLRAPGRADGDRARRASHRRSIPAAPSDPRTSSTTGSLSWPARSHARGLLRRTRPGVWSRSGRPARRRAPPTPRRGCPRTAAPGRRTVPRASGAIA